MSGGTNVGGTNVGGTNVRWDKSQVGQMSVGQTSVALLSVGQKSHYLRYRSMFSRISYTNLATLIQE
jgi:hypothetical protein